LLIFKTSLTFLLTKYDTKKIKLVLLNSFQKVKSLLLKNLYFKLFFLSFFLKSMTRDFFGKNRKIENF